MTAQLVGGVLPATNGQATETQPTELEVQAAARILARHHHPEWRPATDDIDGYGHGWHDGHAQGYADGASQ